MALAMVVALVDPPRFRAKKVTTTKAVSKRRFIVILRLTGSRLLEKFAIVF